MADPIDARLRRMADETIQRYSSRYRELGVSARTLGWGTREQQEIRFAAVRSLVDLSDRDVLDWGCGFGDLATDLLEHGVAFRSYRGVDLNEDFVREAEAVHRREPRVSFAVADPDEPLPRKQNADVVVMLGLANFEQPGLDTREYALLLLRSGFEAARQAVVCDFLSDLPTPGYARETFVHYYDPAEVLRWGLELSPKVVMKHDYPPIPQREMLMKVAR